MRLASLPSFIYYYHHYRLLLVTIVGFITLPDHLHHVYSAVVIIAAASIVRPFRRCSWVTIAVFVLLSVITACFDMRICFEPSVVRSAFLRRLASSSMSGTMLLLCAVIQSSTSFPMRPSPSLTVEPHRMFYASSPPPSRLFTLQMSNHLTMSIQIQTFARNVRLNPIIIMFLFLFSFRPAFYLFRLYVCVRILIVQLKYDYSHRMCSVLISSNLVPAPTEDSRLWFDQIVLLCDDLLIK